MIDVRVTLEAEARKRDLFEEVVKRLAKVVIPIVIVSSLVMFVRKPSLGDLVLNLFAIVGLAAFTAGYTPRHRKALGAAIANPDPALDHYFAQTLASIDPTIFNIGREAFVRRFTHRLPELDAVEWRTVALSLLRTRERDAELLLSLFRQGAGPSTLEAIQGFADTTKTERLRTAALQTLAEIRLRAARNHIVERADAIGRDQDEERQRLRL